MGNRRTTRKIRVDRLTKLIISIIVLCCFLFASGSYEALLFPHDARSLSLNNTTSADDTPLLQNNPAALSMRSYGMTYSYFFLPANIHFGGVQSIRKSNMGIMASKITFLSYGEIIDSETEDRTYAFDILGELGYKKEIKNITSLGISGGVMFSSIAGFHSQLLFSNFGIRSRFMQKKLGIGFSFENVGFLLKSYTNVRESIPGLFRTAFYYKLKYSPLVIDVDITRQFNGDLYSFSGAFEFKPDSRLVFRLAGRTNQKIRDFEDFTSDIINGISCGFGFRFVKMTLDVGLMNLGPAGFILGFSVTKKQ